MSKFLTFDPAKNKNALVGDIINGVLIKQVNPRIHFMRIVDGYGIQYSAFIQLPIKGVKKIKIIEEGGSKWEASFKVWQKNGRIGDYGNGKQVFLSLKFMHKIPEKPQETQQIGIGGIMQKMAGSKEWEELRDKLHSK